jgi:hypothetical protein
MKLLNTLLEGGNVFKDQQGQPLTQRINQADVPATIAYLEKVLGIDFPEERWLGSTGRKPTSGDLDLAVDLSEINKDQLAAKLTQFVQNQKQDPREWVKKAGEVHFRTPIAGNPNKGYVQTDFMFFPNLDWGIFYYGGAEGSNYKGMNRNVLMSSLAKVQGLKVGANGMISRTTNELVRGGQDPNYVAKVLLGPAFTKENLKNVESIYTALSNDPDREVKLKDFREYLAREGLQEPQQPMAEDGVGFLGRLRDRIVNQGMMPLVEAPGRSNPYELYEAEEAAGVGGRAKGIEHLEDLVFRRGTQGIIDALEIVKQASEQPSTTTAKWDGKPAVIWGRKPSTGEFVLTDGSGFEAKGYDGLATSPRMMADIQNRRSGDRTELIQLYATLFPILEASLPNGFRGYVKGDLLYMQTPPEIAGNYVFKPNTIEYKIPARSSLGQRISNSNIGIAVHSMYADAGDARQPLKGVTFNEVPGLMLERPATPKALATDSAKVTQLKQLIRSSGQAINTLFNPVELRANKITDLAKLCVDYINTKVGTPLNPQTLLPEFGEWLKSKVTPQKFRNIVEYLQSPTSNTQAMAAAFTAFLLLHDIKMDILRQADLEHPGQEGWVMATPAGYAKAVNRFDPNAFAAQNRRQN